MARPADAPPRAVIFGLSGLELTPAERRLFATADPLGFILFARNCASPDQVRALVRDLRALVERADAPILIDQEGGRVQRLRPPHWRDAPPAARIGQLFAADAAAALEAARLNAFLIAAELEGLGIDVDCAPVVDVPQAGADPIIGDRAFAPEPARVAELGRAACAGFLAGGVLPTIKHIPGHGRATADSHLRLPVVDADRAALAATDWVPFAALKDMPWAMTAHVVFTAIDESAPATLSARVISDVIRGEIGFTGVLVSDDIGMAALKGPMHTRAHAALAAGCDVALHCSGVLHEMAAVASVCPRLSEAALTRLAHARALLPAAIEPIDIAKASTRLAALLGQPTVRA